MNEGQELKNPQTSEQRQPRVSDGCGSGRLVTAGDITDQMIAGMSMQVKDLIVFRAMLPTQLTPEQDQAVRNILLNYRR